MTEDWIISVVVSAERSPEDLSQIKKTISEIPGVLDVKTTDELRQALDDNDG